MEGKARSKPWIKGILFGAFVYSAIWGLIVVFAPTYIFSFNNLDSPQYLYLWQTIGLVEVVLGIGYLIASFHPYRNWPLVFLGFLFKLFATLIFFNGALAQSELWALQSFIFIDNLLWLPFFGIILYEAYKYHYAADEMLIDIYSEEERFTLDMFDTNMGNNLLDITKEAPTLTVFLRHFGCTFCRESLADIALRRDEIEANGTRIIFVHMLEDEDQAQEKLDHFGLGDLEHISDPECILYKKFRLKKGSVNQLFGLKVWARGLFVALVKGLGQGREMGDSFQMPGVFLLFNGEIENHFIHKSAADRPDYVELSNCQSCGISS